MVENGGLVSPGPSPDVLVQGRTERGGKRLLTRVQGGIWLHIGAVRSLALLGVENPTPVVRLGPDRKHIEGVSWGNTSTG